MRSSGGRALVVILLCGVGALSAHAAESPPTATAQGANAPSRLECAWIELGPFEVPNGEGYDQRRVSVSGRVTAAQFDASTPGRIYVGTALGGVWSSSDLGRSWRPLTDGQSSLAVGALAVDPRQPSTLLVGTGEANVFYRSLVSWKDRPSFGDVGVGLLRSEDEGRSWRLVGSDTFKGSAFSELDFSPHRPGEVVASTSAGLHRSRDGGITWHRLKQGLPASWPGSIATSFEYHTTLPNVAFASLWGSGIFRSLNFDMETPRWERVRQGLPLSNLGRIGLSVNPSRPDSIAAMISDANSRLRGLYESEDGGSTWARIDAAPDLLQGQGFFNLVVKWDPRNVNRLFLGGAGERSANRSSLYVGDKADGGWTFRPVGSSIHVDIHVVEFDSSDAATLMVGSDGGLWLSQDGGVSFEPRNAGLRTFQLTRIAQHPTDPAFVLVGTQDNGTLLYDGHARWNHVDDGDGGFVAISPHDPQVVYDEFISYRIARSEHAGRADSFKPIHPRPTGFTSAFLAPFALDPARPGRLFLALDRLWETPDDGASWRQITSDLARRMLGKDDTHSPAAISAIHVASSTRLFAGTSNGLVWDVRAEKSGWKPRKLLQMAPDEALGFPYVTDLARAGADDEWLFVATDSRRGHSLWRLSPNGLREPSQLPMAGGIYSIARRSARAGQSEVLFLGTDRGVLASRDLGQSWHALGRQLPQVPVAHLEVHASRERLRAATHGRGLWELVLHDACLADHH